ncbi:MAG TPA: phospholipase D-like domain-containing protein [Vicinamibacterales bacterium]|nr:phospholipase D-like domain-containing protein [Vicinamibacterales bacterium]
MSSSVYDPRLSDEAIHQLLTERASAGLDVRIIGKTPRLESTLKIEKYPGRRLHVRAIVRDGRHAFVGSQSLGRVELDDRRELGVIVSDARVVRELRSIFEHDWRRTQGVPEDVADIADPKWKRRLPA